MRSWVRCGSSSDASANDLSIITPADTTARSLHAGVLLIEVRAAGRLLASLPSGTVDDMKKLLLLIVLIGAAAAAAAAFRRDDVKAGAQKAGSTVSSAATQVKDKVQPAADSASGVADVAGDAVKDAASTN